MKKWLRETKEFLFYCLIIQTSAPPLLWLFGFPPDSDWTNEEAVVEPLLSSDVSLPKFDNVYCSVKQWLAPSLFA